ncbi:hypothetical protein DFH11DRAFT_1542806 [Phellopilus nigrolimitatus]|nr:hypothetical protein DFH11DRAFT_1542806 [Phellopilus nigrolimitatus]
MNSTTRDSEEDVRKEGAVLNLPVYATEAEIKERHRALSLVFHPDKQRDERVRESANERFLEIQAAYEVLSDPFLRVVYDTLGYDGLKIAFPVHFRQLPQDDLRQTLREFFYEARTKQLQSRINPRGTLACSLDVRELFYDGRLASDWFADLSERFAATKLSIVSLRHSVSRRIGQQTKLQIISRLGQAGGDDSGNAEDIGSARRYTLLRGNITGVISHQYSAKQRFQVSLGFCLRNTLFTSYAQGKLRRRLFRDTLTLGSLDCILSPRRGAPPVVNITLAKPAIPRSGSWLATGWACGLSLRSIAGIAVFAQWQAVCTSLSTALKIGLEQGLFTGLAATLEGSWESDDGESDAGAAVVWDMNGVVLRMSFTYLGQTLVLPVTLADEYAPGLAITAALVPASVFAVIDYFVLRARRKTKREKRLLDHQRARDDQFSEKRAEAEVTASMLKDTARRSLQAEKDRDGLVILESLYFPLEDSGTPMPDFGADVTLPVQALVHNGQLFIPGGRSKSVLRGFYDPLPECKKRLSVRYEFHGRLHYAEVGEHAPVVLPLESHLVEHAGSGKS